MKFSSLTSLSTRLLLGLHAGQQDRAQVALGTLEFLDLAAGLRRRLLALAQIGFKRNRGRQVAAEDGVNVGQVKGVIGLDNGLRRGPGLESMQDQFQEDAALAHAKDARGILA